MTAEKCNEPFDASGSGSTRKAAFYKTYKIARKACIKQAPGECRGAVEVNHPGLYRGGDGDFTYETRYQCDVEVVILNYTHPDENKPDEDIFIQKKPDGQIRLYYAGSRMTGPITRRKQDKKGDHAYTSQKEGSIVIRIKGDEVKLSARPDVRTFRRRCKKVPADDIRKLRLMLGLYEEPYNP